MEPETGESFFTNTSGQLLDETNLFSDPEFDSCLKIIQKPVSCRSSEDIDTLIKKILSLDIFKKSLLDNLDAKTILTKLAPYMSYEYFPANSILSEYDNPMEKFSIILQGKAKEFTPKSLLEIEREADNYSKEIKRQRKSLNTPSATEQCTPMSLTSLGRDDDCNSQIPTMNTLADKEYNSSITGKFVKINSVLPSLKRMSIIKWKNDNLDEGQCQKVLTRMKSVIDFLNLDGVLESNFAEKQVDEQTLSEFRKQEKNYFLGGILKLKFSKFLCFGDHFGLNVLKGESLANKAVIATEDCHCLTISRDDYFRIVDNEKELNRDKIEFFQKLFEDKFHRRSLAEFALLWENQTCQMNQILFHQNEPSDTLHVLVSGEVVISKAVEPTSRKSNVNEELPYRFKRRQDSSELKLVTICGGNFFGEEDFFNGHLRQFTATVISTRAKVFKLSMQNFGIANKSYKEIMNEIEGLVRAKKNWEKQRLEYLSQPREPIQQSAEQFFKRKNQVIQIDQSHSKNNVDTVPKKWIPYKKEKPINIRFEYDKHFVPKPTREREHSGNPHDVIIEEKSKSMTPHHKTKTPSKGFHFLDYDNSIEDQKSEYLPSVSHVDSKRTELSRRTNDRSLSQNMKRVLDGHFSTSRTHIIKQQTPQSNYNTYNALTENSLKISNRIINHDEESTGRTNIINKSSPNAAIRLESDASLKTLSSNAIAARPISRGPSGHKTAILELMHLLPLSVRASGNNNNGSLFNNNDPLRISSIKGSLKPKIEAKKNMIGVANYFSEKTAKASVRIVKADLVNDAILKSEVTIDNKENGVEVVKISGISGSGSKKNSGRVALTRSRSNFIKNL